MYATKTRGKDTDIFNDLISATAMHMKRTIIGEINMRRSPIK